MDPKTSALAIRSSCRSQTSEVTYTDKLNIIKKKKNLFSYDKIIVVYLTYFHYLNAAQKKKLIYISIDMYLLVFFLYAYIFIYLRFSDEKELHKKK